MNHFNHHRPPQINPERMRPTAMHTGHQQARKRLRTAYRHMILVTVGFSLVAVLWLTLLVFALTGQWVLTGSVVGRLALTLAFVVLAQSVAFWWCHRKAGKP